LNPEGKRRRGRNGVVLPVISQKKKKKGGKRRNCLAGEKRLPTIFGHRFRKKKEEKVFDQKGEGGSLSPRPGGKEKDKGGRKGRETAWSP